jgi:type IV secretion system protein VirB6
VRSLLGVVDCNVQELVQSGYATLFQSSGVFTSVLTVLLTLYVALIGYQLLLGRSQLNVSDFALTAVKLGSIVALATQWSAYQTLVYHLLFYGPQQVANVILHEFSARGSAFNGDVFDGLQRAFTDLTSFSPATPPGTPTATPALSGTAATGALSTLLSKPGFDSMLLLLSAVVLMVSTMAVLLASKIVLGLLLATGPLFVAMLLFDSTRGVFVGWLRASVAFAFLPLAVTLMLGISLTMLEPWLEQIETMRDSNTYIPGVAFGIMVLVMVFAVVAIGIVVAAAMIAMGFKFPGIRRTTKRSPDPNPAVGRILNDTPLQPRATRIAAAATAQERRDAMVYANAAATPADTAERRINVVATGARGAREPSTDSRIGQTPRRNAAPRAMRNGARSEST